MKLLLITLAVACVLSAPVVIDIRTPEYTEHEK